MNKNINVILIFIIFMWYSTYYIQILIFTKYLRVDEE